MKNIELAFHMQIELVTLSDGKGHQIDRAVVAQ